MAHGRALRDGRVRAVVVSAGVVGAYVGAAKLGIALSVAHGVITPVWAPTGIALAALILFGPRLWPAVALGAFLANATSGASIPEAAAISVGNTLEAVVGSVLLLRMGFRPALDRVRDVLALVGFAAVASTTISATIGVTTLWLSGDVSGSSYASGWLLWWTGDAMGALVVAPLLLVWATSPLGAFANRRRLLEALALLALLVTVSSVVWFGGHWRYPHLVFPLLVWATLRFRQLGAVTSSFVVAAIAVGGGVAGNTPIEDASTTEVVQILEGLLAAVTFSMLMLGAVLSERAAGERRLGRARARLAEAQDVAHIGSWEWSIADNRVIWSEELYRLFGLEPGSVAMTYERFLERVHPDDRELAGRIVEDALADRAPFAYDFRAVLPDGGVRWLNGQGRVIVDGHGDPVRLVGTSQDITDRRRLDDLRDMILSTVSHELRTPLTSILGFSITLSEKGSDLSDEQRKLIFEHLRDESRRLERLLTDLLDVDRLRHGLVKPTFQETDVGRLVANVVPQLAAEAGPIQVDVESVVAEIDPPKVERIAENLLANAVKHTPAGTPIRVRVEQAGDGVLIAVDDEGPGVAEGKRETVFELFNRGDADAAQVAGTGIGLALVAQFAALHGGRAWTEPGPEGGSSFRVYLPAHQPR
jgi:PAS domain S-box-containing protein